MWKRWVTAVPGFGDFSEELKTTSFFVLFICMSGLKYVYNFWTLLLKCGVCVTSNANWADLRLFQTLGYVRSDTVSESPSQKVTQPTSRSPEHLFLEPWVCMWEGCLPGDHIVRKTQPRRVAVGKQLWSTVPAACSPGAWWFQPHCSSYLQAFTSSPLRTQTLRK